MTGYEACGKTPQPGYPLALPIRVPGKSTADLVNYLTNFRGFQNYPQSAQALRVRLFIYKYKREEREEIRIGPAHPGPKGRIASSLTGL